MKNLAIIPARGGSKRIPRKNIRSFCGQPIIKYSIDAAIKSNCFDEIMVSTDDQEIADIAISLGAKVPFFRSLENSGDTVQIANVAIEVLNYYTERGKKYRLFCCILPTIPFISAQRIIEGLALMKKQKTEAVFPVLRYGYPIERSLTLSAERAKMRWPENYDVGSQHFMPSHHDAGQFYWLKTESFLKQKKFFLDKSHAIELSELEAQDIDNEEDWKVAELKYKIIKEMNERN
jgi:N-acylneuraminate cytidylyltransferase